MSRVNYLLLAIALVLCFALINSQAIENSTSGNATQNAGQNTNNLAQTQEDKEILREFENFRRKYNKTYTSIDEFNEKYQVFKHNYLIMKKLEENERASNRNMLKGKVSSGNLETSFGNSPFMDMTPKAFQKKFLGQKGLLDKKAPENDTDSLLNEYNDQSSEAEKLGEGRFLQGGADLVVPKNWNWVDHGALNPIQNQGVCGGCWAFSAASNLESQYFLKHKKLPKFSEQQLLDCDTGNSGCAGGIMNTAFDYVKSYGIETESEYPFVEYTGYCQYNPSWIYASNMVKGYKFAGTTDEDLIKKMVYKFGPLSITINSSLLQYYTGGVLNVPYEECPYAPDHGVNIVGYGETDAGLPYWIIRNTWGADWGENGYFRIVRGIGLCGVNQFVLTAFIN